jgi:hypothetical protein
MVRGKGGDAALETSRQIKDQSNHGDMQPKKQKFKQERELDEHSRCRYAVFHP